MASLEPALISDMTNEEFEKRTFEAIQREFGFGGLARFVMTCRSGHGDYTADRQSWLKELSISDILAELQ